MGQESVKFVFGKELCEFQERAISVEVVSIEFELNVLRAYGSEASQYFTFITLRVDFDEIDLRYMVILDECVQCEYFYGFMHIAAVHIRI